MNVVRRAVTALALVIMCGAAALASPTAPAHRGSDAHPSPAPVQGHGAAAAVTRGAVLKVADLAPVLPWFVSRSIRDVTEAALIQKLVEELQRENKATERPALTGTSAMQLQAVQKWLEAAVPGPERASDRGLALRAALRATIRSLDEDGSRVYLPHQYEKAPQEEGFEQGGVGLIVDHERDSAGRFLVITTIDGFPAQVAGIRSGDRLVKVAGHPVKGMTYREMADLVRGRIGTRVDLEVERVGVAAPMKFAIERVWLNPNPKNLTRRVLADGVGYVRIKYLGERLNLELDRVLDEFRQQHVRSVVLDLRNNEGALAGTVDTLACFVPKGTPLATLVTRDGKQAIVTTGASNPAVWPVVVLVNRYSCGASVLLAGALRDAGRAQIVGEATMWRDQPRESKRLADGCTVSVATGYYTLPKGQVLRKRTQALVPETVVPQEPLTPLGSDKDEQLKRAVDMSRVQQTVQTEPAR